ncbi:GLPGLI family protein [Pedobacter miscanthi]|jgi:GLPGLI family protein|uniref:GLPGLI family protein n=1 Tax=Pedobacter miscanthi TaxID=2259170 RepID=UPI00292F4F20|nr:GLPGLI family protein [Pedobacter miscanthi]
MKLKIIKTIVLFLILSNWAVAQTIPAIMVEYQKKYTGFVGTEMLYAQKDHAWYVIQPKKVNQAGTTKIDEKDDMHGIITFKTDDIKPAKYFQKIDNPTMYYEAYIENKPYLVTDSVPEMQWQLIPGQTRQIGNYTCNKAELQFRGTTMVAYYAPDLPISFGPLKFKGLPGVILELYAKDHPEFGWLASKISYPYTQPNTYTFNDKDEKISIKNYVALLDKQSKTKFNVIMSRAPKGTQFSNIKIYRPGIEQVFEWEK